jgi:hypothetical protein
MSSVVALSACAVGAVAPAQEEEPKFEAPPNALSFEDGDCTVELYRSGFLQIRTSKQELWLLKIMPLTNVIVDGEAETEYLHAGLTVALSGTVNRKAMLEEPIREIELVYDKGRPSLGFFPLDDDQADVRPLRNPGPGAYRIRGKVQAYKDKQLTLSIAGKRVTGTLDDEVAIKFSSDDLSMTGEGDKVKVKAWYLDNFKPIPAMAIPGKAWAEDVSATLAKPLAPGDSKSRR